MNTAQNSKFDLSQIMAMSYEDVQARADKLAQSDNEDDRNIAKALKELPKECFEISLAQKKLQEFIKLLGKIGYSNDQVWQVIQGILYSTVHIADDKLNAIMSDKVKQSLREFRATEPNVYQEMIMLNYISQQLAHKDLDYFFDEALTEVVEQASILLEEDLEITQQVSKLDEKTAKKVNKLFDDEKYLEAFDLIYKESK